MSLGDLKLVSEIFFKPDRFLSMKMMRCQCSQIQMQNLVFIHFQAIQTFSFEHHKSVNQTFSTDEMPPRADKH